MVEAIFVVGTGRSGTHFTCRALAGFANILDPLAGQEDRVLLREIATAALYQSRLPNRVLDRYADARRNLAPGQILLDQHHPNLFFFDQLSEILGDIIFLYPSRPVVQVVASMLRHKGVLRWDNLARKSQSWFSLRRRVPVPNRFLGLGTPADLFDLDLHQRCALRVLAHDARMKALTARYACCRFLSYEALVTDQQAAFSAVFRPDELAALGAFSVVEPGNPASLSKFRETMSPAQIRDVEQLERDWTGYFEGIG